MVLVSFSSGTFAGIYSFRSVIRTLKNIDASMVRLRPQSEVSQYHQGSELTLEL